MFYNFSCSAAESILSPSGPNKRKKTAQKSKSSGGNRSGSKKSKNRSMFGKGKQGGRFPLHSRRTKDGKSWEIVHSRAVKDRREDLDEVRQMLEGGELDIAEDELRWLLEDCHEMIQAHHMLGEIALIDEKVELARGHFGYGYELGLKALQGGAVRGPLPYKIEANRPFFHAGEAFAEVLFKVGEDNIARDVLQKLIKLDPADPLNLKSMISGEDREHQEFDV